MQNKRSNYRLKIGSNDKYDDLPQQFIHNDRKRDEKEYAHSQIINGRFCQVYPQIVELVQFTREKIQPIPLQLFDFKGKSSQKERKISKRS